MISKTNLQNNYVNRRICNLNFYKNVSGTSVVNRCTSYVIDFFKLDVRYNIFKTLCPVNIKQKKFKIKS